MLHLFGKGGVGSASEVLVGWVEPLRNPSARGSPPCDGVRGEMMGFARAQPILRASPYVRYLPRYAPAACRRANRPRSRATVRMRQSRMFSIAISAAGVTTSVSTVAKPRPNTMAVERLIHHCVAGAPIGDLAREELDVDAEGDRQHAEDRGHRGEHHRPRALAAGLEDGVVGRACPRAAAGRRCRSARCCCSRSRRRWRSRRCRSSPRRTAGP